MLTSGWIDFLRCLPPPLQHNLVLNTTTGSELAIQSIVRTGSDYIIIRGRLTGTTEAGGFFLVPLERINYLGFPKIFKENEFRSLIGEPQAADEKKEGGTEPAKAAAAPASEPEAGPPADSKAPVAKPAGNGHAPRMAPVDKAALLERLRARRPAAD